MRFTEGLARAGITDSVEKVRVFFRDTDLSAVGNAAFYGYFAINVLMKAFTYDHGDPMYKYFFVFGMAFLAIKVFTTKYTMREISWAALLMSLGLVLSVINKQNTWLLLFATMIGMKNCKFYRLIQMTVYIRVFSLLVLVLGSTCGVFDIGFRTTPDTNYVEIPVYSFAMSEPNTAFLAVFLTLVVLLYYNYRKLDWRWFLGTSAVALLFYRFTFCRTGITVFFFCLALIIFEKRLKSKKAKFILALSVPVGALFSIITMMVYNGGNSVMYLLNHFVSGRIYIMNGYYSKLGLSLLPRTQEYFYGNYFGLIDNTYMFVLLYCGWIVALFFFFLVTKSLFRLYRGGHYKELVMIGTMSLYGVLEQFVMNGFMNPFILLCGGLLFPEIFEEIDEKKA